MARAAKSLLEKFRTSFTVTDDGKSKKGKSVKHTTEDPASDKFIALVDGNKIPQDLTIASQFVIKGDSRIYSIAAASIIAKVTRDRIMTELDKKYPVYLFAKHKGYPTFEHRSLLVEHGPCEVHRVTYGPVKKALEARGLLPKPSDNENEKEEKKSTKRKNVAGTTKKTTKQPEATESEAKPTTSKTKKSSKPASTDKHSNEPQEDDNTKEPTKQLWKRKQSSADTETNQAEDIVPPVAKKQRQSSKAETSPAPEGVRRSSRIAAK
jgi:hypothetical protein